MIRRSDAIKAVKAYLDLCCLTEAKFHRGTEDYNEEIARDILDQITPSIDIVRCKECKHWRNTDAEKIPTASIACGNMHADDFCSYGERDNDE